MLFEDQYLTDFITFTSEMLWGSILIYLLIGGGLYFTIRTGFIQLRHFTQMFLVLNNSLQRNNASISSFQALCTIMAFRVGSGRLIGVAIAIIIGGPGAIFWMWIVAIISMATSFIENTLTQLYKTKDSQGYYRGGPAYYMERGLGMRWMGILFSVFLILAFGLIFNAIQANTIAQVVCGTFHLSPIYVGVLLVLLCASVIFGGLQRVAKTAAAIVPFITLAYLLLAIWVVGHHLQQMPQVFTLIIKSAFGVRAVAAGTIGHTISQAMAQGIQRSLFSNEAGMGATSNVSASAYATHPVTQGYIQMLGIFIDTLVICSITAAIILSSGVFEADGANTNGLDLIQRSLAATIGDWGYGFMAIAVCFFGFTAIIANYAYAESNLAFLRHNHPSGFFLLRLTTLGMILFGALSKLPIVWKLADLITALMTINNMIALLLLSGVALKLAKDYQHQSNIGRLPTFDIDQFPELKQQVEPGIWESPHRKKHHDDE